MSAEEAVRAVLLADPTVAALVGDRVYPMHLPQTCVLPAIVYQRISTVGSIDLGGDTGLSRIRLQVTHWAEGFDAARALARATVGDPESVEAGALTGYSGDTGAGELQLVRLENLADVEDADWKPGTRINGVRTDIFVSVKGASV